MRKKKRERILPSGKRSKLEEKVGSSLKRSLRNGRGTFLYENRKLKYILEKNYVLDYEVFLKDGRSFIIEVKGYLRPTDRTKMIAVKKQNPEADIRFIFPQDNKLHKSSKTRYSEWATKHGFTYHIGTDVPKEWLK